MAAITLKNITKRFASAPSAAVDDVSLEVPAGAFLALLGPSGCGKTTLLRLIAGLEHPDAGTIRLGDRVVAEGSRALDPERRGVGMVFQSYALWPHKTVARNVSYSLEIAGRPRAEIARATSAMLERVGLVGFDDRLPETLSGGQRQRVALARALVQDASVVLCDEPLANLDVHLRDTMLATFADLHRSLGRTFVYVTHDQAEALALATIVAVMDRGRIVQAAPPVEIYAKPANRTLAGFIGRGSLVEAEVAGPFADGRVPVTVAGNTFPARADALPAGARVTVLVRPEAIAASETGVGSEAGGDPLRATVTGLVYRGAAFETAAVLADGQRLLFDRPSPTGSGTEVALAVRDAWVLPEA